MSWKESADKLEIDILSREKNIIKLLNTGLTTSTAKDIAYECREFINETERIATWREWQVEQEKHEKCDGHEFHWESDGITAYGGADVCSKCGYEANRDSGR